MRKQEFKNRNRQRKTAAKRRTKTDARLPLPLRAEAMFNAIKNGEVEQVELKGEEAIQFFMNHPKFDCTRVQAEKIVSTMTENNNKLMTTVPKRRPKVTIKPNNGPSLFKPEDQIEEELVFDYDEGLFSAIEHALGDPEVNVVMVESEKSSKEGYKAFALGGPDPKSKVSVRLCCDNYERAERARERYGYDYGLSHDELDTRLGLKGA